MWMPAGGMYPWVCTLCESGPTEPRHLIDPEDPEAEIDDEGPYIPGDVLAPMAQGIAQHDRHYRCPNADLAGWVRGLLQLWADADESMDTLHRLIPRPSAGLVAAWGDLRDAVAERRMYEAKKAVK